MANGAVDNVSVIHGVDPLLDNEAVRVLKLMSSWIPGKQGGKAVNVWYSVPITFALQ
jgi:protein TonB